MTQSNNHEQEFRRLRTLANDASREGQYAVAEKLMAQGVTLIEQQGNVPLLITGYYHLAIYQRLQGRARSALALYSRLVELATDPELDLQQLDQQSLRYLTASFVDIVVCGRSLPGVPIEYLFATLADGLSWIDRWGKPQWKAAVYYEQASLLFKQGKWQETRQKAEAALSLVRRNPDAVIYSLLAHLKQVAFILASYAFKEYEEAERLVEEMLTVAKKVTDRFSAYLSLSDIYLKQKKYDAAKKALYTCQEEGRAVENREQHTVLYRMLGRYHREQGELPEAMNVLIRQWHWMRGYDELQTIYIYWLRDCVRLRLEQAKQAMSHEEARVGASSQAAQKGARVYLHQARRFFQRTLSLAIEQDLLAGTKKQQNELNWLKKEIERVAEQIER